MTELITATHSSNSNLRRLNICTASCGPWYKNVWGSRCIFTLLNPRYLLDCGPAVYHKSKMIKLVDESMLTTSTPKSKGSYDMVLHKDHGDSLISFESMTLPSRWLSSDPAAWYCVGWQIPEYNFTYFSAGPSPELMSCSWQEVSDLSPNSAWDDLQLCSPAMSQQGDPSLKAIHPKSMQQMTAAMHQEKLQWCTTQRVTAQEDIAYALFGIFDICLPTIEKKHSALGWLLQHIVARSGDITALDWVGKSSEFNTCLPGNIASHKAPPSISSTLGRLLQDLVACFDDIIALDWVGKSSKFNTCPPGDITSHKAPPSIFQPLSADKIQKSPDRRSQRFTQRAEHYRARYQLNCPQHLPRRHSNHNLRRHNTRSHNTGYCQPAHKTKACQITLYITAKITHHGVCSPYVHPLADARSVK